MSANRTGLRSLHAPKNGPPRRSRPRGSQPQYTPALHVRAGNIYSGHAAGVLTVTGTRKPHWSTSKGLSGEGETESMQVARPACEAVGGTLDKGQLTSLWRCRWPYVDHCTCDFNTSALLTSCNLSGGLSAPTTAYSDTNKNAVTQCTNEGG